MQSNTTGAPSWASVDMWTEAEFAALRGVQTETLRNERCLGNGPPWARIGKRIVYPIPAAKAWIAAQIVTPTRTATLADGNRRRRSQAA